MKGKNLDIGMFIELDKKELYRVNGGIAPIILVLLKVGGGILAGLGFLGAADQLKDSIVPGFVDGWNAAGNALNR